MSSLKKIESFLGTESVWATMKKLKLIYMFRDSLKSVKIKVGKRFIALKEERGMMTPFMIASIVKDN